MVEGSVQKQDVKHLSLLLRFGRVFKSPGDVPLGFRIGLFIWNLPRAMQQSDLPSLLERIRKTPQPKAVNLASDVERVVRLRQPWFRLPPLAARNTCYIRAITLYRFLSVPEGGLKIHFGVESPRYPGDNTHGHAWVTVNGRIVEPPEPVLTGRVKELYVYPPT